MRNSLVLCAEVHCIATDITTIHSLTDTGKSYKDFSNGIITVLSIYCELHGKLADVKEFMLL